MSIINKPLWASAPGAFIRDNMLLYTGIFIPRLYGKGDFGRVRIPSGVIHQASRFLVGAKTQKLLVIFLKFQHDIPSNMGMCK